MNARYQLAGKLIVKTNAKQADVFIDKVTKDIPSIRQKIQKGKESFKLREGRYRISLQRLDDGVQHRAESVEVEITPFRSQEVTINFPLEGPRAVKKTIRLNIVANISDAGMTLWKLDDDKKEYIDHVNGKNAVIIVQEEGKYEIQYDAIPTYNSPATEQFELLPEEEKNLHAIYTPVLQTVAVAGGSVIIGDPSITPATTLELGAFGIGTYAVTNVEYARWLNNAYQKRKIVAVEEADRRGQILDMAGRLLFKTLEADVYSQISMQSRSDANPLFIPVAGKDLFPVINVSWYGAAAFCLDNNFRLPTEAEWEKAAAMALEKSNQSLKKYIFGFSNDTIDRTWANYKDNDRSIQYFQVATTPVGFYNGGNHLPLSIESKNQEPTHDAKSPSGAYDMSGNVWEWVADWYTSDYPAATKRNPQGPAEGTQKVAKGGCFDSLADGVRVSERLGLPPDHTDAYTGFRIAVDDSPVNH